MGAGVPKDSAEAVKWFRLAADQGYGQAQYNLGLSYAKGIGVEKDDAEAVKWWRLVAEQGIAEGQIRMVNAYGLGVGIPMDFVEANKWAILAASNGQSIDIPTRVAILRELSPEQIAESKRLAEEWKPTIVGPDLRDPWGESIRHPIVTEQP
jgi:TPR repeat protein